MYISQPSRAVAVLWKIGKIPVEEIHITLKRRQHLQTNFIKINPRGQVPVLIDDGNTIWESNAILKYLCHKHQLSDELYPQTDILAQARVNATLDWNANTIRPAILPYIQHTVFRILVGMDPLPKKLLDPIITKAHRTMKELNEVLSFPSSYPFFTLNTKTIADLQIFEELHLLDECSNLKVSQYKNVERWYTKIFENDIIQEYHRLMVKQLNIDFENDIKFTKM